MLRPASLFLVAALASIAPAQAEPISFVKDVEPILERSCMACHACYDAPCQLKLTSAEGLLRGASKQAVYDASRLRDAAPTRLFVDAPDAAAWREKGFAAVTEGGARSLMARMLELGRAHLMKPDQPIDKDIVTGPNRKNECPKLDEIDEYARKRPAEGMPFGVAPLPEADYATLQAWLEAGAPIDAAPIEPTPEEALHVRTWETFLNQPGAREKLVARYIYEHLFLAHLHFGDGQDRRFFELVRSHTPPGAPIEPVATVRPTGDPGGPFFYRLRPIQGTLVHKTHITYDLTPAKLARYRELFFQRPWEAGEAPAYGEDAANNPFQTFRAIPAEARYRFLLDDAEYFVRTFIRGPVCRGQIATDVIDDHFHAVFQNPDTDLFLLDQRYAATQLDDLHLPGEKESEGFRIGIRPRWMKDEQRYTKRRMKGYVARGEGAGWDYLWDGYGTVPDAQLTVFRHHDSATVTQGLVGDGAKTVWLFDYPILERVYYLLVVNFDVFGRAAHQVKTRLYFDLLRAESEANFLRLFPKERREEIRKGWYQGTLAGIKRRTVYEDLDEVTDTRSGLAGVDPVAEFVPAFQKRVTPRVRGAIDYLNQCRTGACSNPRAGDAQRRAEAALQRILGKTAAENPYILFLPEITFLRVVVPGGDDLAYTLTRDRSHMSVAFMLGEDNRRQPEKDKVTLSAGPLGSYPNFIFRVELKDVEAFAEGLLHTKDQDGFQRMVQAFGVRRTDPRLWETFHFFTEWMVRRDPREAGLYDLNRYENF